jgi:hypothetical protein
MHENHRKKTFKHGAKTLNVQDCKNDVNHFVAAGLQFSKLYKHWPR